MKIDDIRKLLRKHIPGDMHDLVSVIAQEARGQNVDMYIVGGAVRDLLLGRAIVDLDFAVERDTQTLARKISRRFGARLTYYSKFGTAKLKFQNYTIDIITTRKEIYKKPGALPTVRPGTIVDDLSRRDFTVNAMAVKLPSEEIVDPLAGQKDIRNKYIRVLHDKSFIDDATRIFRAVRYEQRLGFKIEAKTLALIKRDIEWIDTVSPDRIKHELILALNEEYPELFFSRASRLGVLRKVFAGLNWIEQTSLNFGEARKLAGKASLPELYFSLLIYGMESDELAQFIRRYNFARKLSEPMLETVHLKNRLANIKQQKIVPSDLYKLLIPYSSVAVQANLLACKSVRKKNWLRLYLSKLRPIKTVINGADLVGIGIRPGPFIGKILDSLLDAKINGKIKTRSDELEYVKRLLGKEKKVSSGEVFG